MITREFLTAGKAHFTVTNNKGEHFTYKVTRSKPTEQYPNPAYFVLAFTGTDNTAHYTYMGRLDPTGGNLMVTARSRFPVTDVRFRVALWAISIVYGRSPIPAGYDIKHEGKCGRCGRLLTNPDSIDSGIGPECIKIMGSAPRNRMAQAREAVRLEQAAGISRYTS